MTSRTIWVVRHAEREDNINSNWRKNANPHKLKADNSPLSARGRKQAQELAKRFSKVHIDVIFASPFERTMETATALLADRKIAIKSEPGLLEALYLCEKPPSFHEPYQLVQRFPLVDVRYEQIYTKPMPKEGYGDDACTGRIRKTLDEILKRHPDASSLQCSFTIASLASDSIVLVSHGSPIGGIHEVLCGEWNYVGQATVSKFVETARGSAEFRLEFSSDASHLVDKSNLRAY